MTPLGDSGTAADLAAIAAHRHGFEIALAAGLMGTILLGPALLGLAILISDRCRLIAPSLAVLAILGLMGFTAVRLYQVVELQTVVDGIPQAQATALLDHLASNPIAVVILLVMFVGGMHVALPLAGIGLWRSRLAPRPAGVSVAAFPFADLLAQGHLGTLAAHLILLAGLGWAGLVVLRIRSEDQKPSASAQGGLVGPALGLGGQG